MDFWLSTLSNLIATLIGAAIVALIPWIAGTARRSLRPPDSQGISIGGDNFGDASIHVDNRITAVNNIDRSRRYPAERSGDQANDEIVLIAVASVVAATLFAIAHEWLMWASIGVSAALLAVLVRTVFLARRQHVWRGRDAGTVVLVIATLVATTLAWVSVYAISVQGHSIGSIRDAVVDRVSQAPASNSPIAQILVAIMSAGAAVVETGFPFGIAVAIVVPGGIVLASAAMFTSWTLLLDWNAYVRLSAGTSSERIAKRADAHLSRSWHEAIGTSLILAMSIVFSSGLLLRLFEGAANEPLIALP